MTGIIAARLFGKELREKKKTAVRKLTGIVSRVSIRPILATSVTLFVAGCMTGQFVEVRDQSAFAAIADKTIVYETESARDVQQVWHADGTGEVAGVELVWRIDNGQYCAHSAGNDWTCYDVSVSEDGQRLRFVNPDQTWVGRYVN